MKIVIEVNDDQITRCVSTDEILRYFAEELKVRNKGLYDLIHNQGKEQAWNEAHAELQGYGSCCCH